MIKALNERLYKFFISAISNNKKKLNYFEKFETRPTTNKKNDLYIRFNLI